VLRVGFAGAGFIAGVHADVLAGLPDVRIAAVHDPDPARAHEFAAKCGADAFASFEQLLDAADAVYVCSPNAYHAEQALSALAAGKHVFSEKPMGTSLDDARRVLEAARAARAARGVYAIGFNRRLGPVYQSLKQRIDAGELTPRWAHMKMNRGELVKPAWVADPTVSGGFLYESTIHLLDLADWLFGPLDAITCHASQTCAEQLDDFAMLLSFASGMTATFCSSAHATWLFPFERIEVYGDHASGVTEELDRVTFALGLDGEPATLDFSERPFAERWGYRQEDEAFLAALRGEGDPAVGAAEGYRAIELVDACYRAAESGRPAKLS
jgi:myo-inositol 2-dehydrogenase/D-chiro-inositol 1-dehydrogenase